MMYFAKDGNYGESDGLVIVDPRIWSEDEWAAVEDAPDFERPLLALKIANLHN